MVILQLVSEDGSSFQMHRAHKEEDQEVRSEDFIPERVEGPTDPLVSGPK